MPAGSFLGGLESVYRRLWPAPPELPEHYTLHDFGRFMREETFRYSARYVRRRVVMHGQEHLLEASRNNGAIVAFLHYGSWILAGGAIARSLGLPYTVIASRRNLDIMPPDEKSFWQDVHLRGSRLYGQPLFYTDQYARQSVKWLRKGNHVLGVLLDVREPGHRVDEFPFQFLGHTVYMQCGPARLARIADAPLVPAGIVYRTGERRHHLYFEAPVLPDGDPLRTTQRVLAALEKYVAGTPQQQFHDIISGFSQPATG